MAWFCCDCFVVREELTVLKWLRVAGIRMLKQRYQKLGMSKGRRRKHMSFLEVTLSW